MTRVRLSPEARQLIRDKLAEQKMSQAELARRISTHQSTINAWLSGALAPSPEMTRRIARVLHVKLDELVP